MPSWFPGSGFKRTARKWRLIVDNALRTTYEKVKADLVRFYRFLVARQLWFVPPTKCMVYHFTY
jgi:hypothetical protein